ncbi:hypothetical protein E2C01_012674 [Portunus trituberculatus]|uniref:Uncharacterized protein n=1 Tax=Portunus trituberculatus TaxID=210409 RepID=A0A5B7DF18_PORTR|nr:hypothetical protein [Portunus trituberculatus]
MGVNAFLHKRWLKRMLSSRCLRGPLARTPCDGGTLIDRDSPTGIEGQQRESSLQMASGAATGPPGAIFHQRGMTASLRINYRLLDPLRGTRCSATRGQPPI